MGRGDKYIYSMEEEKDRVSEEEEKYEKKHTCIWLNVLTDRHLNRPRQVDSWIALIFFFFFISAIIQGK